MTNKQADPLDIPHQCRLCDGALKHHFDARVLSHRIQYFLCNNCGSLQTETPYWLDEAYANNLADIDTGAAQRCFANAGASYSIARIFGVRDILDIGGGDGLHCRLLRDQGLNAFVTDRYAKPVYAQGFTRPDYVRPQMAVSFEVVEHFSQPKDELPAIFSIGADIVLISTGLYRGQGADWWYLTPDSGQHVFFYSDRALQLIAARFDYVLIATNNFSLFARSGLARGWRLQLARLALRSRLPRVAGALMMLRNATGAQDDKAMLEKRIAKAAKQPPCH